MNSAWIILAFIFLFAICAFLLPFFFPIENDDKDWLDWDDFGDYS